MAVYQAIFVSFLCLHLGSSYVLIGEDENEIVWPTEYHMKGEKINFMTTLKEPFEIWYSAERNRSRIDLYEGNNKKLYFADIGTEFLMFPRTVDDLSSEMMCLDYHMLPDEEQMDFMPYVSDLTYTEDLCDYKGQLGKDFKTDIKALHPDFAHDVDIAFESYTTHHNKVYDEEESQKRKQIFEENWRMVHEHNNQNHGYRLELNEYSDKTDEELQFLTGTYVSDQQETGVLAFPYSLSEVDEIVEDLPENFDLRLEGAVTPVKSQGQCGSCWAFATTAAVEGALARVTGDRLLDLSEQSLVDCAWNYQNLGCNGGTLDGALKYVLAHGIPTERDYGVYTEHDGFCEILNMTSPYSIKGFTLVTPRNPSALKVALYKYGPVSVAIHSGMRMKLYASGVFYDYTCDGTQPNHGVTVVGYGVRDGEDYWIVKNSWGEGWGEDGYILMSAKNNNCFVLDSPYYPIV